MDMDASNRAEWERRRRIRLVQVRDQSKKIAKTIRDRVQGSDEFQFNQHEMKKNEMEHKFKSLALNKLKSDFEYLITDVGNGYSAASVQPDPNIVLAEKRLINRCKAISRGAEAEKRRKRVEEEQQMDKEMRQRRTHFNKTVEKIRSTLISSIPNVDEHDMKNMNKNNECFLIPSQVTLNESNILNWNCNNKTTKPWSMVLNSNENHQSKILQSKMQNNDKENDQNSSKLTKLENNVKNYEALITELNKLSAEEQIARDKLFKREWKEKPVQCKRSVPIAKLSHSKDMDTVSHNLDVQLNDIENKKTEKRINESNSSSSMYTSLSASIGISNEPDEKPVEYVKKINAENKENKKNSIHANSKLNYNKKTSVERPLKNINNVLQRIKTKKQLLAKEISADTKVDKPKTIKTKPLAPKILPLHKRCAACSNNLHIESPIKTKLLAPKISPIAKRCAAGRNNLHTETPIKYAKLPDSFYNNELESLKKQISQINSKSNTAINEDLMVYINLLLKMTPTDVDNLSVSTCSSLQPGESTLQESNKNTQYYSELLNCISKCLNADISDINQDSMFDSPRNINLLNRLQELSKYYLEKTCEIKNICDESPNPQNDKVNEHDIETETEICPENSLSSHSSIDSRYILGHLNTLLMKRGLIKSDNDWPMFENITDSDDNRSLTDQLLDVYP